MILLAKQKWRHRHRSNIWTPRGDGRVNWEIGIDIYTLLTCVLVAQSGLTLCDPMDCIPPVSSVHGILQARILVWVTIPFSRG